MLSTHAPVTTTRTLSTSFNSFIRSAGLKTAFSDSIFTASLSSSHLPPWINCVLSIIIKSEVKSSCLCNINAYMSRDITGATSRFVATSNLHFFYTQTSNQSLVLSCRIDISNPSRRFHCHESCSSLRGFRLSEILTYYITIPNTHVIQRTDRLDKISKNFQYVGTCWSTQPWPQERQHRPW